MVWSSLKTFRRDTSKTRLKRSTERSEETLVVSVTEKLAKFTTDGQKRSERDELTSFIFEMIPREIALKVRVYVRNNSRKHGKIDTAR